MSVPPIENAVTSPSRLSFLKLLGKWLLIIAMVSFGSWYLYSRFKVLVDGCDFDHYYASSWLLTKGEIPYCRPLRGFVVDGYYVVRCSRAATNPPLLVWIFSIFTTLAPHPAWQVIFAINIFALFSVSFMALKLALFRNPSLLLLITVVFVTLFTRPFYENAQLGQIQLLIYLLCLCGIHFFIRARHRIAGCLWGAAIAIKFIPALIVLWLIFRKQWLAAGWTIGVSSLLLLVSYAAVGPEVYRSYFDCATVAINHFINTAPNYISFHALFHRLLEYGGVSKDDIYLSYSGILRATSILTSLILFVMFVPSKGNEPRDSVLSLAAVVLISFFSFGMGWPHYLIALLLPFLIISQSGSMILNTFLAIFVMLLTMLPEDLNLLYIYAPVAKIFSLSWITIVLWTILALNRLRCIEKKPVTKGDFRTKA